MQTLRRLWGGDVIRLHTRRQVCGTHGTCRMSNFIYVYEFCEIPTRNRCRRLCRQISPGLYIIIIIIFLLSIIYFPRRSAQSTLAPVIVGVRAKFSSNFRDGGGGGKGRTRDLERVAEKKTTRRIQSSGKTRNPFSVFMCNIFYNNNIIMYISLPTVPTREVVRWGIFQFSLVDHGPDVTLLPQYCDGILPPSRPPP